MQENTVIQTFETSVLVNIWAERLFIIDLMVVVIIGVYGHFNLNMIFELLLLSSIFIGVVFLGFIAIGAHVKYYFKFERHRKVELYADRIIIYVNNQVKEEILKSDITRIILYDKRHTTTGNVFPTLLDSFYYLIIMGKNQDKVILTCLLDIGLKKKITAWYGQELEHTYQFFPFPK